MLIYYYITQFVTNMVFLTFQKIPTCILFIKKKQTRKINSTNYTHNEQVLSRAITIQ